MAHVIGIDLGTVNSCVSVLQDGVPRVLADEEGRRTTPSIYALTATDEPLVGYAARAQQDQNRLNTIFAVKRLIGLKYDSDEVRNAISKLPYKIIPASNGDAWVEVNGQSISPEEVSARVLERMKQIAENALGERVFRAVITVPAHFNDSQRQATKNAARIAGLDVLRVINEPTAAALSYGMETVDKEAVVMTPNKVKLGAERIVTVFDLGGGTFDVSVLALRQGVFDVLSTQGDTFLGGEDFDLAIMNYIVEQFRKTTGHDLTQNKQMLQRLKSMARDAKHSLSTEPEVRLEQPYVTANLHLDMVFDRRTMEKVVQPLIKRLEPPCRHALEDAGITKDDVDETILVGGMTRMPAVRKLCRQFFGKEPIDKVDPDEAVALGAAIQAGLLQGLVKGVSLLDVTSLSLGIEIQGGMVHQMIPRNTKVPTKVTERFTTSAPNQPQVSIHLLQGESNFAPDNTTLGRFELTGIKQASRGVPTIEVTLEVDSDGIVHVAARDQDTGEEQRLDVVASSGLSDSEIDQLLRENQTAAEQRARISSGERSESVSTPGEVEEAQRALRSEIFMLQFQLDTEGKTFRGNAREMLETCLVIARDTLEFSKDATKLLNTRTALRVIGAVFKRYIDED